MAETTGIGWTDATQNFWEGCQKAGPGCDNCYAEARDQRWHGGEHWGPGATRRRVVDATFRRPLVWDRSRVQFNAVLERGGQWPEAKAVPPQWVFAMSLGDFLDPAVDPQWRADAWAVIRACTSLRWQIVTKRASILERMLPADWDGGASYGHVGLIATAVTQAEMDAAGRHLGQAKRLGVRWTGVSIEPQLEPIRLGGWDSRLDWVICGGESGPNARQFDLAWAEGLVAQCAFADVPCFVKQMGARPGHHLLDYTKSLANESLNPNASLYRFRDKAGADPREWPAHLRVQQMPTVYDGGAPLDRAAAYR